jgi:hypothetical protein
VRHLRKRMDDDLLVRRAEFVRPFLQDIKQEWDRAADVIPADLVHPQRERRTRRGAEEVS